MIDPKDNDDPWADLYRDLDLGDNTSAVEDSAIEEEVVELVYAEGSAIVDSQTLFSEENGELDEVDDSDEPEPTDLEGVELDSGSDSASGEPGQKKRRRRRRRRKKNRSGTGEEPSDSLSEPARVPATRSESVRNEPVRSESDDPFGSDEDAEEFDRRAEFEDSTPESTRELFAGWNVPSWQEIIAGLYRPER